MKRKTLSLRPLRLCGNIFYPLVSRVWPLKAEEKTGNQLFPITHTAFCHKLPALCYFPLPAI
jgi:hypothetical protein